MHGVLTICGDKQQVLLLLLIQLVVLVLMASFITYAPDARPDAPKNRSVTLSANTGHFTAKIPNDEPPPIYPCESCQSSKTKESRSAGSDTSVEFWDRRFDFFQEGSMNRTTRLAHAISLLFIEGFLLSGILAIFDYTKPNVNGVANELPVTFALYQDVHVMIWIGFGFLMTFLRRYGQSAVGLTFLVAAILVQVAMLCEGAFNIGKNGKAPLSLDSLLSADVAVAAPLISMGALLGKTTYMQLIVMGIIELVVYTLNKYIGEHHFVAVDAGDSMYVHAFGAYFGLAVSFVHGMKEKPKENSLEGSSYESDILAMVGTIFLWLFWPSFNSAALKGDEQRRAIINTLLSIAASCVVSFAVSAFVSKQSKFNMVHVQNSTLAGGVAIGTAAGMMCEPVGALAIGSAAGAVSVLGYKYLTPLIQKRLRIHDTCGVHNLHGMPAILAGLLGALLAGLATEADYNYSLYDIFPARIPGQGSNLTEINENYRLALKPGPNRSAGQQAAYQLLALAVTLAVAIVSGLITGLILRMSFCGTITEDQMFDDSVNWEFEDENAIAEISSMKDGNSRAAEQLSMSHI